jgi:hypothetical protein
MMGMRSTGCLIVAGLVTGCSTGESQDVSASIAQEATASGTVRQGDRCKVRPIYVAEKCEDGLVCGLTNVCVRPSTEAGVCNPVEGNAGCQGGLRCVAIGGGTVGYCKGAGMGPCNTTNPPDQCAVGRACVSLGRSGSTSGTCEPAGSSGAPCDLRLVENACVGGLKCFPTGDPTRGVCRVDLNNIHTLDEIPPGEYGLLACGVSSPSGTGMLLRKVGAKLFLDECPRCRHPNRFDVTNGTFTQAGYQDPSERTQYKGRVYMDVGGVVRVVFDEIVDRYNATEAGGGDFLGTEKRQELDGAYSLAEGRFLPCEASTLVVPLTGTCTADFYSGPRNYSNSAELRVSRRSTTISYGDNYQRIPILSGGHFSVSRGNPNGGEHFFSGRVLDGNIEVHTGYTSRSLGWSTCDLNGFYNP